MSKEIKEVEILKAIKNDLLIKYAVVRNMNQYGHSNIDMSNELNNVISGLSQAITAIDLACENSNL